MSAGHYTSFKLENDEENELLRVYPVELRRQYMPESTERTTEIAGFEVRQMVSHNSFEDKKQQLQGAITEYFISTITELRNRPGVLRFIIHNLCVLFLVLNRLFIINFVFFILYCNVFFLARY